ncbi:MAG: division/cell wall cluster transcriptional repressor MraZ, partial [Acidobacteria bacterium]|nr:division/cell wall cluster transcriptional repressor MraZ [Acidobacteriota bacterium]
EQGRVLIPGKLRDKAEMKGDVTLFWHSNHIEVYSQARYQSELEQNQLGGEDFENLAKLGI